MTENSEFNFDDFNVFINKTIKEEPLDDEEVPESLPVVVEGFVDPRQHSNLSSVPEIHAKIRRVSSESNQIDEPRINFGASTSAPSRDPRLRNPANVASAVKRQMFLEGSLHADDLIRGTSTKDLDYQPKQIKKIRTHTGDVEKTINSQSTSFHSNLPNVQVLPTGMVENRSPVISNNHNAHFVSFATPDNIKEALKAQRYRNIPRDVQDTAQRVGADLDAISQRMRSRQEETLTSYSSNSRTLSTQTNSRAEATSQASNQSLSVTQNGKTSVEAETQTTKNSGVFSITIDNLSELTNSQRKALEEFKKVMNIKDETTTNGLLERLQHRQANKAYKESRNNNDFQRRDDGYYKDRSNKSSSSRERNSDAYSNPPAPTSSYQSAATYQPAPKRSKYANIQPK